jgi:hypothetical protein
MMNLHHRIGFIFTCTDISPYMLFDVTMFSNMVLLMNSTTSILIFSSLVSSKLS